MLKILTICLQVCMVKESKLIIAMLVMRMRVQQISFDILLMQELSQRPLGILTRMNNWLVLH